MAAQKRIGKELGDIVASPPAGIKAFLSDESNLFNWKAVLEGPSGSPYAGYCFNLQLTLPANYPFKPPVVNFSTKIYHPNVSNDSPPNSGTMCLGMLRDTEWKPSTRIVAVLEFARQLLKEPNVDDAIEGKIAEQYRNDRAAYEKEAREWCKRYATQGSIS